VFLTCPKGCAVARKDALESRDGVRKSRALVREAKSKLKQGRRSLGVPEHGEAGEVQEKGRDALKKRTGRG